MTQHITPKLEVSDAEDLGISQGFDDFDSLNLAAEASSAARRRFILACDATSSMGTWWKMAQAALQKSVDEVASRTHTPWQVKVVAYRDHTCDSRPLEESSWSNNPEYLKDYIKHIECDGGGDYPESVGLGLAPAAQSDACMVILIGDAPGRSESTGLDEAKILGKQKCPVFALYCTDEEKLIENFQAIAQLSGGKAMHLKDAKTMTDIFSALLAKVVFQISYQATSIEGRKLMEG